MSEQIYWYTARASGMVALALVTASVVWGLLFSTRLLQGRPSPKWLMALHRHLGALAAVFTGVHIAGLVLDSYVEFGPSEILVPFASTWQPQAVAWGVVGMYLLGAIELTSLLKKRIPRRLWRWVHLSSYVLFWLSIVHGVTAGTDAGAGAYIIASRAAVMLVVFLTVYRVLTKRKVRARAVRQVRAPAAEVTVPPMPESPPPLPAEPRSPQRLRLVERVPVNQEKVRRALRGHPAGAGLSEQVAAAPRDGG